MFSDSSDDEQSELGTPICYRKKSQKLGSSSMTNSSVVFRNLSKEMLAIWSRLPEAVRLDPSLAAYQRDYDNVHKFGEPSTSRTDCFVVNMSLTHRLLDNVSTDSWQAAVEYYKCSFGRSLRNQKLYQRDSAGVRLERMVRVGITSGKIWPLITTICMFTVVLSCFLDNVATILLMTPVTIRLCEVMQLNPVPVLTTMLIFSNIGGATTPVGDPPNVIICSNKAVIDADLRHEIVIWQRAAASLSSYSKDENIVRGTLEKKVKRLLMQLKQKLNNDTIMREYHYKNTLEELKEKYPIRNKILLVKSGMIMLLVIILFFLHSIPNFNLSLGWSAFLGVLLLLIIADKQDLDGIMARVEWSTLLFFAALFVLMEALTKLGLITWIGNKTELIILSVDEESRLAVAILLLLWVSSIAGAFVDNVPLATMMIRIATRLAENQDLRLPLQPLVWALAFGSCMGGNGTLIGATANVVCAGVAEQHGYRFTFCQFFKMGFPVLLISTMTVTLYLMVAHVAFDWNY
ncbi:unnamed protein product [Trichogramma brassicae]|uniref:Citrate transporter-like domain-containing protein n=1 Tax=Trichogramma brassicae TaxID=86971 RepID=A0A6H5IZC0_9HYME|nr:unnamed protein product [Trichogramma brassicae]